MPSTAAIRSTLAFRSRSTEPKAVRSNFLRFSLTPGQSSSTLSFTRRFIKS